MDKLVYYSLEEGRKNLMNSKMIKACLIPFFTSLFLAVLSMYFTWDLAVFFSKYINFEYFDFLPNFIISALNFLFKLFSTLAISFSIFSISNTILSEFITLPTALNIALDNYPKLKNINFEPNLIKSLAHSLACLIFFIILFPFCAIFLVIPVIGFFPLYTLNAWLNQKTLRYEALSNVCNPIDRKKFEKLFKKQYFHLSLLASSALLIPVFNILANGYITLCISHLSFKIISDNLPDEN